MIVGMLDGDRISHDVVFGQELVGMAPRPRRGADCGRLGRDHLAQMRSVYDGPRGASPIRPWMKPHPRAKLRGSFLWNQQSMREYRGSLDGRPLRVAIAVSRYNETVTRGLLEGARAGLAECGVPSDAIDVAHVPGALELPVAARELALSGRYDALVVLGAVIRGETDHYDYVCAETTRGCGTIALETGVPVGFGVLTCETLAQARDRSTTPAKNKGAEAARSAIETANLLNALRLAGGEIDATPSASASTSAAPASRKAAPAAPSRGSL